MCESIHLFLGTQQDNVIDMINKKRKLVGAKCPWSKLTEEQVLLIRDDERPMIVIAEEYGVHPVTIRDIKVRRNWKWL